MNHEDTPASELKSLARKPSADFKTRLHRRIERRVFARDLSVMYWQVPKLVLSETLFICAAWLGGHKRKDGGRS